MEADVRWQGFAPRTSMLAVSVVFLASCSGGGGDTEPTTSTSAPVSTATPSPTSTIDPAAQPAVDAYEAFNEAANNAQRHPFGPDDKPPAGADFRKYSWDPFRGQYTAYIWGLANDGGEFRGAPPTLHVTVKAIRLNAKDWPTVILSDCQTEDGKWRYHNAKTGKVQPEATQKVSPPYRSTVTMILYKKRWGVQKVALDSSRTCTP